MQGAFTIRPYRPLDQPAAVDLFVRINKSLTPPGMETAFADYVARSIDAEIGRIDQYYDAAPGRGFWVATDGVRLLGYFGLEPTDDGAIEVRRMYVDFLYRRMGVARAMLSHAEAWAQASGFGKITLSTSSLQLPALALYQSAGFTLLRQEIATASSHKTVGNGILRFYLEKPLKPKNQATERRQSRPVHGN